METCPKAQQFANVGLKIAQYYFKPLKIAQRLAEFGQSCETSPNLVTLHQTDISDDIPGTNSIKLYGSVNYGFVVTAKF